MHNVCAPLSGCLLYTNPHPGICDVCHMNYKKDQFDLLFEKFIAIQAENTNILNDYVHTNNQLIETLIGGI